MLKKSIAPFFIFISILFFGYANDPNQSIDLTKAVELSLKESEDYQIQENEIVKADAQYKEIMSMLFPQIKGDITWLKNFKYANDLPKGAFTKNYNMDLGVSANQIITTFGKIYSSLKGSKKFEEAAKEKKKHLALELSFATKMIYYNVCFAKKILEITELSYKNSLNNREILLDRFHEGRISKRDNIKLDADVAARIPQIAGANTNYSNALETLKKQIGVDLFSDVELSSSYEKNYPSINKEEAYLSMYDSQPILKALKLIEKGQDYFVKSKIAEYYPTVSFFGKYNYKGTSDADMFIGNNFLRDYGVFGININIPIFQGLKRHQQIKKEKMNRANSSLNYQKTKKQLDLELEKTLQEYDELMVTLPANTEAVSLAQQSFDMSQDLFKSGQLSATDLNDAELMLTSQKIRYETTLFKLNVALKKLEKLTGNRYSND